jgi:hypothetical protein
MQASVGLLDVVVMTQVSVVQPPKQKVKVPKFLNRCGVAAAASRRLGWGTLALPSKKLAFPDAADAGCSKCSQPAPCIGLPRPFVPRPSQAALPRQASHHCPPSRPWPPAAAPSRLLGLGIDDQQLLFEYYTDTLDATIAQLKSEASRSGLVGGCRSGRQPIAAALLGGAI